MLGPRGRRLSAGAKRIRTAGPTSEYRFEQRGPISRRYNPSPGVSGLCGKRYLPHATAIEERHDVIVFAGFGDRHAGFWISRGIIEGSARSRVMGAVDRALQERGIAQK